MSTDTIVTVPDTTVMYVAGGASKPIAEQAPRAFKKLESKLSSPKGRRFYGVVLGDEYRACVTVNPGEDQLPLPHPTWTLPGGKYVRRKISNWEENLHLIGSTCQTLSRRADFDPSRPIIEYCCGYRQYGEEDLGRLGFIRNAKALGVALEEIKEVLAFRDRGEAPCP